jgi:hypothetical protein
MKDAMTSNSKRQNFIDTIRIAALGWLMVGTCFTSACRRMPTGDSEAGRITEARKYLKTVDLRTVVDALAEKSAGTRPDKAAFKEFVGREIRWSTLEESMVGALAKHFTGPEMQALTDFQNSAAGRSLIEKYSSYQADIGPAIQAEFRRVVAAEQFARTHLRWDSPVQELTLGPTDESLSAEYSFSNEGSQAIRLVSITTSCGCTTAKLDKDLYQPGEKSKIRVLFTKGGIAGERNERVTITTDEPNHPAITLQLKVKISAPLKITPSLLVWASGEKTAMKTVTLEIPPGAALDIVGVDSVPAAFTAKPILDKGNQIYLVHLTPRAATPMAGKFFVLAAAGGGKVLRIPIYLRILPPDAPAKGTAILPWDETIWIAALSPADYKISHIPGSLLLTEEAWDDQFEAVLARWTPGKRIVLYGGPEGQATVVLRRLNSYGLDNLHVIFAQE